MCHIRQELKGRFLVKGKRLTKLEACFGPEETAGDDGSLTEEEEDDKEEEEEEKKKATVGE